MKDFSTKKLEVLTDKGYIVEFHNTQAAADRALKHIQKTSIVIKHSINTVSRSEHQRTIKQYASIE